MGDEDHVENLNQEEYRSLSKMLQGAVRDTVRVGALLIVRPLMAS